MTENITIEVDGEDVNIEVEELSNVERMKWAGRIPREGATGQVSFGPQLISFSLQLLKAQTILTDELIEDIPEDELGYLMNAVIAVAFGNDAPTRDELNSFDAEKASGEDTESTAGFY